MASRRSDQALPNIEPEDMEPVLPAVIIEDDPPEDESDDGIYTSDLEELYLDSGEDVDREFAETWNLDDDEDEDDETPEATALRTFNIDKVLGQAIDRGASDVHISADDHIAFTILKDIHRADGFGVMSGKITEKTMFSIISSVLEDYFVQNLELDTSYVIQTGPHRGRRTRLNIGRAMGKVYMVFRVIADEIPTPQKIGITQELLNWTHYPNGLILICGPTGSGKSTSFASLMREIQLNYPKKIITVERPIEYLFGIEGKGFVTQREVGVDTVTFGNALTSAMRQAPDVIMIGEVRNHDEVSELLRASESGHLAMSTMHTNSCAATINRIQSLFEGDEQKRILSTLSDNLRGICNQVLVKSPDGSRVTAVREILPIDGELRKYISQGDVPAIRAYQEQRRITMEDQLLRAYRHHQCTLEEARSQVVNQEYFDNLLDND